MQLAAFASRYWPFANGSGRILDRFGRHIDLGSGERLARTSDDFDIHVRADDLIGRHILLSGKFDRSVVQILLDAARAGDVMVDIGANVGYVSACFLKLVERSSVVCVEPQPGIVELLEKNMQPFGTRAQVHRVALSDREADLRFRIDETNRGASKICDDGDLLVPAINAALFFAKLERVDLIKIDVEGHEEPIFRAIGPQLERLKPRAILFEDQSTEAGGVIGDLLKARGYAIFGIEKRLTRTSLAPVNSPADCRFNDYIACLGT